MICPRTRISFGVIIHILYMGIYIDSNRQAACLCVCIIGALISQTKEIFKPFSIWYFDLWTGLLVLWISPLQKLVMSSIVVRILNEFRTYNRMPRIKFYHCLWGIQVVLDNFSKKEQKDKNWLALIGQGLILGDS